MGALSKRCFYCCFLFFLRGSGSRSGALAKKALFYCRFAWFERGAVQQREPRAPGTPGRGNLPGFTPLRGKGCGPAGNDTAILEVHIDILDGKGVPTTMRFLRVPHGDCDDARVRRYLTGGWHQEMEEPEAPAPSLFQRTRTAALRALALICSAML